MSDTTLRAVHPYLFFPGNCKEAMNFYQGIFGGNLEVMPFEGSPLEVPDEYKQNVMHSTLQIGSVSIMASDGMPGQEVPKGGMTSLSLDYGDVAEAEKSFHKLAKGGKVTMPFQKTFWGSMFGSCTDQYGIDWMVSCEITEK